MAQHFQNSDGKVWFINGASRGFGADIARAALDRGDCVVATARNPSSLADWAESYPNLRIFKLDVSIETDAVDAAKKAIDAFGRIDVLVNNAGYGLLGAVEESSDKDVRAVFDVNVFGLLNVTRAVLPYMRRAHKGHIVNLSSIGGYASYPGWGVYCSTKFAVAGLSEALSIELAPLGIYSTVVEPGFFRTDFLSPSSLSSTSDRIAQYAETVGKMRDFAAGADHKQPGDSKKLASAILKLVDAAKPPVRLPLGNDTVAKIRAKNAFVATELEEWLEVASSTDHDDVKI